MFTTLTNEQIARELERTGDAVRRSQAHGSRRTSARRTATWTRGCSSWPRAGVRGSDLDRDTLDWEAGTTRRRSGTAPRRGESGEIILMHTLGRYTASSLIEIVNTSGPKASSSRPSPAYFSRVIAMAPIIPAAIRLAASNEELLSSAASLMFGLAVSAGCAYGCWYFAKNSGRNEALAIVWGIMCGVIALLVYLVLYSRTAAGAAPRRRLTTRADTRVTGRRPIHNIPGVPAGRGPAAFAQAVGRYCRVAGPSRWPAPSSVSTAGEDTRRAAAAVADGLAEEPRA